MANRRREWLDKLRLEALSGKPHKRKTADASTTSAIPPKRSAAPHEKVAEWLSNDSNTFKPNPVQPSPLKKPRAAKRVLDFESSNSVIDSQRVNVSGLDQPNVSLVDAAVLLGDNFEDNIVLENIAVVPENNNDQLILFDGNGTVMGDGGLVLSPQRPSNHLNQSVAVVHSTTNNDFPDNDGFVEVPENDIDQLMLFDGNGTVMGDGGLVLSPQRPFNHLNQPVAVAHSTPNSDFPDNDGFVEGEPPTLATPQQDKPRKILRNPASWKRNKAKAALNKGQEHQNYKGNVVRARKLGPGCKPGCRLKCSQTFTEVQRQKIFDQYWAIGDHTRQYEFLSKHLSIAKPLKHRAVSVSSQRQESVTYYLKINGKLVKVCKPMFLGTLDISETPVRTVRKKLSEERHGGEVHVISPDKRGSNCKFDIEKKKKTDDLVMKHIKSFKTVDSHYCRQRSKRKYLDSSLDRTKMWEKYKTWMEEENPTQSIVSKKYYCDIFNTKFNLGFHMSKKDLCDMCFVYELASVDQKQKMQESYGLHIKNKNAAAGVKDSDKAYAHANKETVCYAVFDLEKILETPKLKAGTLYYLRKLSLFNFTVWDGVDKQGYCYTWHEGEGKKGANEVATGVLKFIEVKIAKGIKSFFFWSDNCSAQNKNKFLFSMYTYASAKYGVKIVHRYLEKGHTHNEADNMHAAIERMSRSELIFEPNDWLEIIKKSSKTPYHLMPIGKEVLDFHPLANDMQNWQNTRAKWKQVREIQVFSDKPGRVFLKHDLTEENPIEIKVSKAVRGRPLNLGNFEFRKAFDGPLPLNPKKLKDLAKLCNDLIIPAERHAFYKGLLNFPALTNPLLEDGEVEAEEHEEEEDDPGLMWGDENDEETDYEEELRVLRSTRSREQRRNREQMRRRANNGEEDEESHEEE